MSKVVELELINKYRTEGDSYEFIDNTGKIIRCKDCDHCLSYGDALVCNRGALDISEDDFCSKAEPKREHKDKCETCKYEYCYWSVDEMNTMHKQIRQKAKKSANAT